MWGTPSISVSCARGMPTPFSGFFATGWIVLVIVFAAGERAFALSIELARENCRVVTLGGSVYAGLKSVFGW